MACPIGIDPLITTLPEDLNNDILSVVNSGTQSRRLTHEHGHACLLYHVRVLRTPTIF